MAWLRVQLTEEEQRVVNEERISYPNERIRERMRAAGSLVFQDLDFMGLFLELTLFRRMDVLAERLVPWEPMNHEQRLALLLKRTSLRTPGAATLDSNAGAGTAWK